MHNNNAIKHDGGAKVVHVPSILDTTRSSLGPRRMQHRLSSMLLASNRVRTPFERCICVCVCFVRLCAKRRLHQNAGL